MSKILFPWLRRIEVEAEESAFAVLVRIGMSKKPDQVNTEEETL